MNRRSILLGLGAALAALALAWLTGWEPLVIKVTLG